MYFIISNGSDCFYNLALEECLLKKYSCEFFMLWQNKDSVIIGRNQDINYEVNFDSLLSNDIKITRRLSGGGTVYHDMGNINFTFIQNYNNFDRLSILNNINKFLNLSGVNSYITPRFDIMVNDYKISGTAQYKYKDRVLFHGTLLYESNLNKLNNVLDTNNNKSKKIKSVKSKVVNINDYLNSNNIIKFKNDLFNYLNIIYKFDDFEFYDDDCFDVLSFKKRYYDQKWICRGQYD